MWPQTRSIKLLGRESMEAKTQAMVKIGAASKKAALLHRLFERSSTIPYHTHLSCNRQERNQHPPKYLRLKIDAREYSSFQLGRTSNDRLGMKWSGSRLDQCKSSRKMNHDRWFAENDGVCDMTEYRQRSMRNCQLIRRPVFTIIRECRIPCFQFMYFRHVFDPQLHIIFWSSASIGNL